MNDIAASNVTASGPGLGEFHTPASTDEVVSLVKAARQRHEALYPISRGLNWGYGSASPVVAGCSLVDLGGMRAIRNAADISLANPVALIEPGVTQGQLYQFLERSCPGLTFNVTGSGRDTSIIGNALDRGVGYLGPRRDDLFGLEVVTGTGQILKTGFRRLGDESLLACSHPFGLGPMLDGLFSQGNFGIVTSACLRLFPRRPKEIAVSLALKRESDFPAFIDTLAALKRESVFTSVAHIGNRARSHGTLMHGAVRYLSARCGLPEAEARREAEAALDIVAPHEWTGFGGIAGNAGQVRSAVAEIRGRLRAVAITSLVTGRRLAAGYALADRLRALRRARAYAAALAAIGPLHGLAMGVPTDVAVDNLLWQFGAEQLHASELDRSECGLLFVNPALPMDGGFVAEVLQGLRRLGQRHGHRLYVTVNIETPSSLVAVINLLFRRSDAEQVERAHRCADEMLTFIHDSGLEVYRARADMMGKIVARDPAYWGLVRELKRVLDPDNIIAPGRYNLAT